MTHGAPATSGAAQSSQQKASTAINVKIIDFNVAVRLQDETSKIKGGTGLKEWSAPETRLAFLTDYKIDCWTLGCVMFLLCTGDQPFKRGDKIEITPGFNLLYKLADYS